MDDSACRPHPVACDHEGKSQGYDVVCIAGGVAGKANATSRWNSGLAFAVVDRELVAGAGRGSFAAKGD